MLRRSPHSSQQLQKTVPERVDTTQEKWLTDGTGSTVTVPPSSLSPSSSSPLPPPPLLSSSPLPVPLPQSPVSSPLSPLFGSFGQQRPIPHQIPSMPLVSGTNRCPPPPNMSAATETRERSWSIYLLLSLQKRLLESRTRGGGFDLISKSKCISSETGTTSQLAVISCADDSGWQCGRQMCFLVPG